MVIYWFVCAQYHAESNFLIEFVSQLFILLLRSDSRVFRASLPDVGNTQSLPQGISVSGAAARVHVHVCLCALCGRQVVMFSVFFVVLMSDLLTLSAHFLPGLSICIFLFLRPIS